MRVVVCLALFALVPGAALAAICSTERAEATASGLEALERCGNILVYKGCVG